MFGPAPEREPMNSSERLIYLVFLVGILGLFAAEIIHDYQPVKLTALFIIFFWIPLLVLHEGAHAVIALLLGWHVGRVVIGVGKMVGRFFVGQTLVEIRLFPVGGFTQSIPGNLRSPQLKSALIYFAGPGSELAVLGLLCYFIPPARLLTGSDQVGMLAAQSLTIAILFSVVCNLIPYQIETPRGPIANDGLGIIRSFFLPVSYFADLMGANFDERAEDWRSPDPPSW